MDEAFRPLAEALRERGDAVFLEREDGTTSGAQMLAAIAALERQRGALPVRLQTGDVVALRGEHVALQPALPLAAWSLGLCTQLLGARETRSSLDGLLGQAGARLLLTWEEPGVLGGLPLARAGARRLATGTLLATSGSAGRPKLVYHRLERHLEAARAASTFLALGPSDRLLLSLPTWHVGGLSLLLRAALSGARLCVPPRGMGLDEALARFRPTQVSLVATQLRRLLRVPAAREHLRACRTVLLGGGPCPVGLRAEALAAGVPLAVSYGATETAAFVAATRNPALVRGEDVAGPALPGRAVFARGDEDDAREETQEIWVGSPTLLDGYLEPQGLVSPLRATDAYGERGLWPSGDLGVVVAGVLRVVGRRDRMFVSGGENVHPEEIEAALLDQPRVAEAVVVPVPDEEYGLRPVAFVAGGDLEGRALDAALREVLPGFKTPDVYYRLPEPDGLRMKPDVRALAAAASDALAARGLERI